MKKYIIAFLLCAFSVCGYTQKSFIKDALKRGPNEEGIYRVENPKGKNLRKGELEEAIINMGYLPISGKGWFKGSDFDDWRSRVGYYDFIDNKNYPKYIFCKLRGSDSEYKYSQLKNRGYFFIPTKKREKKNSSMPWTEYKTVYDLNRQTALWSGDIVNGYLHGSGFGLVISGGSYQWFTATFYEGLPIYSFYTRSVNTDNKSAILNKDQISYNSIVPIDNTICMRCIWRYYCCAIFFTESKEINDCFKKHVNTFSSNRHYICCHKDYRPKLRNYWKFLQLFFFYHLTKYLFL